MKYEIFNAPVLLSRVEVDLLLRTASPFDGLIKILLRTRAGALKYNKKTINR